MQIPKISNPQLVKLVTVYWQWRALWLATTIAFAFIGLAYVVLLKSDTWMASQGIIVRDEANGAVMRLGRFQSQTEMKAAQETILEMSVNAQVLREALTRVGREPGAWFGWIGNNDKPPTAAEIDSLARGGVQVRAPRGAELGTTEVIYLDVKQASPTRAIALNRAVFDALQSQMQHVRQSRADGVIAELTAADETIRAKLNASTEKLTQMETEAGADLSDLRGMTDSNSGGSSTRQVLDTIKAELRQAELLLQQLNTDLMLASNSFENPDQLLLTPSNLINTQAGLKSLRDGLAAATINSSKIQGRYTSEHPLVLTALQSEVNLRNQLRNELGLAVKTLSKDVSIAEERVSKLRSQQVELESSLEKIARIRADYSNVASEVKSLSLQLQECGRELGQAQASRLAAATSSLITRLDEPVIGEKPIGPGRGSIVVGATASGFFFGLGLVFLLSPLGGGATHGRRLADGLGTAGRRGSDANAIQIPNQLFENRRTNSAAAPPNPAAQSGQDIEVPEWAKTPAMTRRFVELVDSWKASRQPIQPVGEPAKGNAKAGTTSFESKAKIQSKLAPSLGAPLEGTGALSAQASLPPSPTVS